MRIKNILIGIALSLFTTVAFAGEGHDHSKPVKPVSAEQAVSIATRNVNRLADTGKIAKSWKGIKAGKAERKAFDGAKEWVVVFENRQIADASKKKIYVFLTLAGDYLAANYTGK